MGKIIFVLGGARGGKSSYAIKLAEGFGGRVAFIATCSPLDEEMKKRIKAHKKARPNHWNVFEETKDIPALLEKLGSKFNIFIIDCLTLLVSNLLLKGLEDKAIEARIKKMLELLKKYKCKAIIVSNEVGLGIVPDNRLARRFRDLAGRVNQIVAREADDVFFMASGLPLKIKGEIKWKK